MLFILKFLSAITSLKILAIAVLCLPLRGVFCLVLTDKPIQNRLHTTVYLNCVEIQIICKLVIIKLGTHYIIFSVMFILCSEGFCLHFFLAPKTREQQVATTVILNNIHSGSIVIIIWNS